MASSSSSAAAAAPGPSVHYARLREAHGKMLKSWKDLLTDHPSEQVVAKAFLKFLGDFPDAKRKIAAQEGTMLSLALPQLFPTLGATAPELMDQIAQGLMDVMIANAKAEMDQISTERELPTKFAELDKLLAEAEKGKDTRPAPLEVMPEDEHRSHAMEVKLGYEKQLKQLLESLRRENASLEGEVVSLDSQAKVLRANVESKTQALHAMAKVAEGVVQGAGDGDLVEK